MWKILFNSLRKLWGDLKKEIIMLKSYLTPKQHYIVWIIPQHKISFVASFTISKWLKKYYLIQIYFCIADIFKQKQLLNTRLNMCSSVVNSQRLFYSQKAEVKSLYQRFLVYKQHFNSIVTKSQLRDFGGDNFDSYFWFFLTLFLCCKIYWYARKL